MTNSLELNTYGVRNAQIHRQALALTWSSHRILQFYSPDHSELLMRFPHVRALLCDAHERSYWMLLSLEHHWIQALEQSDHCFVAAYLYHGIDTSPIGLFR